MTSEVILLLSFNDDTNVTCLISFVVRRGSAAPIGVWGLGL